MEQTLRRLAIAGVFFTWVLPRILPLILYPGVYCFDTWFFMAHAESILVWKHIPSLDPFEYYYISHPALYLFSVQLTYFLGLPLIESFQIFAMILVIAGFLAFFVLFRQFLGAGWFSIIAMLLFSVAVDVIAQTHCVIQENMALLFLALILLLAFKVLQNRTYLWFSILPIFVFAIILSHHLTTYFTILFCIALLFTSLVSKDPIIRKKGTLINLSLIISLLLLLVFINPVMMRLFVRYNQITVPALISIGILSIFVYLSRNKIWRLIQCTRSKWARPTFITLGILIGAGFFLSVLLFYPYDRTLTWIVLKFGLFSILLGFSIATIRLLPLFTNHKRITVLFFGITILILGLSFFYTGIMTLVYAAQNLIRIEVSIGHRHFTFLLIPLVALSSIAIFRFHHFKSQRRMSQMLFPSIALMLLIFSVGGILNLYNPAGGWYPEYCDYSEINTGLWLRTSSNIPATVSTDKRLIQMMEGMAPIDSGRFILRWLNLSYLSNPKLILNEIETHNPDIYFLTSSLSERYFISEFLNPPIEVPSSELLNNQNSVAKIYARNQAEVYWLIQD